MPRIELLREGGVARLRFNRPERLNALSPQLLRELVTICRDLSDEDAVRVVALEGGGDSFSAGADLPLFAKELSASPAAIADLGRIATDAVASLPQITLAAVHGNCVGGGVVLAAACDLRIAADDSRFWIPELEAGIPLAWGGMAHLVRLVGETIAADLVLSCRRFDAEEALNFGFVSRVIAAAEFDVGVTELVETISSRARRPLRTTKDQLRALRDDTYDAKRDADALLHALEDPEAAAQLRSYTDRLS